METLKINNKDYVINLKWTEITPYKEISKKFLTWAKESDAKYGFVVRYHHSAVAGFIEGEASKPKFNSALAYLANANAVEYGKLNQNNNKKAKNKKEEVSSEDLEATEEKELSWISVQRVNEEKIWLGVVINGLPFVEKITDISNVTNILYDILNDLRILSIGKLIINIYASEDDLELILNRDFSSSDCMIYKKDFSEIIEGVKYHAVIKSTSNTSTYVTLLGIILFGVAGYYAYTLYEDYEMEQAQFLLEQKNEEVREELKKKLQEYENKKEKTIEIAKEKLIKKINEKLTGGTMKSIVASYVDVLGRDDVNVPGWQREQIKCEIKEDTQKANCTYVLKRNKTANSLGTVKNIQDYFANKSNILSLEFSEDGEEIKVVKSGIRNLDIVNGDYNSLTNYDLDKFRYENLSELQLLTLSDISYELAMPKIISQKIELPSPPNGISQDYNFPELNLGISEGEVTIKGKGLYKLMGLGERLSKMPTPLYIKDLGIKVSGKDYDWELKTNYYIEDKTKKGGNFAEIKLPKAKLDK